MRTRKKTTSKARILLYALLTITAFYFLVTSSFFITSVVIPYIANKTGFSISASTMSISPLRGRVEIKELIFDDKKTAKIYAQSIIGDASLFSLLFNEIDVSELSIHNATVFLTNSPSSVKEKEPNDTSEKKSDKNDSEEATSAWDINLRNISATNVTFEQKDLERDSSLQISNISFNLDQFTPNTPTKLQLSFNTQLKQGKHTNLIIGSTKILIKSKRNEELIPYDLDSSLSFTNLKGTLNDKKIDGREISLQSKLSYDNDRLKITSLKIDEIMGSSQLSKLSAQGTFNPSTLESNLTVAIEPLSSELINLAGAIAGGYSIGKGEILFKGKLHTPQGSTALSVKGDLRLKNISPSLPNAQTLTKSPLSVSLQEDIRVDIANQKVSVNLLDIEGIMNNKRFLSASVNKGTTIDYSSSSPKMSGLNPGITFSLAKLDLTQLSPFLSTAIKDFKLKSGILSSSGSILQKNDVMTITTTVKADEISAIQQELYTPPTSLHLQVNGVLSNDNTFRLNNSYLLGSTRQGNFLKSAFNGTISEKQIKIGSAIQIANNNSLYNALPPSLITSETLNQLSALPIESVKTENIFSYNTALQELIIDKSTTSILTNKRPAIALHLLKPMTISQNLKKDAIPACSFKLQIDKLALDEFNTFAQQYKISDLSGLVDGHISFSASQEGAITTQGNINADHLDLNYNDTTVSDLSISLKANASSETPEMIKLNPLSASFTTALGKAGTVNIEGDYNYKNKTGSALLIISDVNQNILSALQTGGKTPQSTFSTSSTHSIKLGPTITSTGTINAFTSLISESKDKEPISSEINYDLKSGSGVIDITKLDVKATHQKENIIDATISGKHFLNHLDGTSMFKASSSVINVDKLQQLASAFSQETEKNTSSQGNINNRDRDRDGAPTVEEPGPFDLSAVNAKLDLNLQNILYGETKNSITGQGLLQNNQIRFQPLIISVDNQPLAINAACNLGASNGLEYALKAKSEEIDLSKLLSHFTKEETTLTITSTNVDVGGKGITPINIQQNLSGNLAVKLKDMSLPTTMKDTDREVIKKSSNLLFDILDHLDQTLGYIPGPIGHKFEAIRKIRRGEKNLNFSTGEIELSSHNQNISLSKIELVGPDIDKVAISGDLQSNEQLNLTSSIKLGILEIPVIISGTLENPHFNITRSFEELGFKTIENTVNTVKDTVLDLLTTPEKLLDTNKRKDARKGLLESLIGVPPTANDTQQQEQNNPDQNLAPETSDPQQQQPKRKSKEEQLIEGILNLF